MSSTVANPEALSHEAWIAHLADLSIDEIRAQLSRLEDAEAILRAVLREKQRRIRKKENSPCSA